MALLSRAQGPFPLPAALPKSPAPPISEHDARHLHHFLAGAPIPAEVESALSTDLARRLADAMRGAPRGQRDDAFNATLKQIDAPTADAFWRQWHIVDPDEPESRPTPTLRDCPTLPTDAQLPLTLATSAGEWVDGYAEYSKAVSPMTPHLFHESAALMLVATAIARRLVVAMPHGRIYPNLAVLWIAETTLWRKTTTLDVSKGIARREFPYLLASQETTMEALVADLAGCEPPRLESLPEQVRTEWQRERDFAGQKGWYLDEASGLLASAGRDYNAGLLEALMRFYDCDERYTRSTRGQGRITVRHAYLSLIGASTPLAVSQHLMAEKLWSMGWWPRFGLLTPDTERPEWRVAVEREEPASIAKGLSTLLARLPAATWPDPPEPLTVSFGEGVFTALERYSKAVSYDLLIDPDAAIDSRLKGTYGRLPTQALKIATILAALDWTAALRVPRIELCHLARAIAIAESWRASAHRLLAAATQTDFDALRQRIVRQVARFQAQGGITRRDLGRAISDKTPDQLSDALRQLVEAGELESDDNVSRGGRATCRYRLVGA